MCALAHVQCVGTVALYSWLSSCRILVWCGARWWNNLQHLRYYYLVCAAVYSTKFNQSFLFRKLYVQSCLAPFAV